jgi:hypothetical protein
MVVRWRDDGKMREREVPVRVADRTLHLGDDRVLGAGARRLLKQGRDAQLLWSDPSTTKRPDPADKYRFTIVGTAVVAGRPTTSVAIERVDGSGGPERLFFDRASGLLLRRDQWNSGGRLMRRVAFVDITEPTAARGKPRKIGTHADDRSPSPMRDAPGDVPGRSIGDGFELLGAYGRADGSTQLYYSDGLFGLSLFAEPGDLAWSELPPGGSTTDFGGVDTRVYRTPGGSAVVWEDEDITYTCVTDAPLHEIEAVVVDLEQWHEPSTLEEIGRFVTGPFSWR